jgi:hypothetical protein
VHVIAAVADTRMAHAVEDPFRFDDGISPPRGGGRRTPRLIEHRRILRRDALGSGQNRRIMK